MTWHILRLGSFIILISQKRQWYLRQPHSDLPRSSPLGALAVVASFSSFITNSHAHTHKHTHTLYSLFAHFSSPAIHGRHCSSVATYSPIKTSSAISTYAAHGLRPGLPSERLRRLCPAHGFRRGMEGRLAECQWWLRAPTVWSKEDRWANRPSLCGVASAQFGFEVRPWPSAWDWSWIRDWNAMAHFHHGF